MSNIIKEYPSYALINRHIHDKFFIHLKKGYFYIYFLTKVICISFIKEQFNKSNILV